MYYFQFGYRMNRVPKCYGTCLLLTHAYLTKIRITRWKYIMMFDFYKQFCWAISKVVALCSPQHLVFPHLFHFSPTRMWVVVLHCGFILHFPNNWWNWMPFYTCLLVILCSLLCSGHLSFLFIFLLGCVSSLMSKIFKYVYIMDMNLLQICL